MSVAQPVEGALAINQSNSLEKHRTIGHQGPSQSIPDIISASEAAYNDSQDSQENASSNPSMSQGTSLSSQEVPVAANQFSTQPTSLAAPEITTTMSQPVTNPQKEDKNAMHGGSAASMTSNGTTPKPVSTTDSGSLSMQQRGILGETYRLDTTAGQKRTANGQVKPNSASPSRTSADYLRTASGSPQRSPQRSPQIGQLTAQLKTRLSYAMVKVQKGWESKNINEVESLAAQQASPLATTPNAERLMASPRSNISRSPERAGFVQSDLRTKLSPSRVSRPARAGLSPDNLSTSSSSSEIMGIASGQRPLGVSGPGPSLAPPVDLSPRNPRRSNPPVFQRPQLSNKNTSNLSQTSVSSSRPIVITATPPAIQRPLVRTPSEQKASAMEQDAIETLLFMSSPGNSQYRPSSQPISGSPLRGQLSQDRRHRELLPPPLPKVVAIPNDDAVPISPRKKNFLDSVNLENNENIDRVLDQMPAEEETSSDEDAMSLEVISSR